MMKIARTMATPQRLSNYNPRQVSHKITRRPFLYRIIMISLSLYLLALALVSFGSFAHSALTRAKLEELLFDLREEDLRIVRWDASEHTAQRQSAGGCDSLSAALDVIIDSSESHKVKAIAAEYATFCITDNPEHRQILSKKGPSIYKAVADLIASNNNKASAMASHLVYIASFANADNHSGFFKAGAVAKLSVVIQDSVKEKSDIIPFQVMWAAAALQNLAASYCNTENNGRCFWEWPRKGDDIALSEESLPMLSSGEAVRKEIVEDPQLIEILVEYACEGPVQGEMSDQNPFPGENAKLGRHELSHNIVAWAATGALKNIALEPSAKSRVEIGLPCYCRMARSADWLEENKGSGLMHHLRRDDPCWFSDEEDLNGPLCMDRAFLDAEGYTCTDYGSATKEECKATDAAGVPASVACCGCRGGDWEETDDSGDEL
jgi:hypothetical protein